MVKMNGQAASEQPEFDYLTSLTAGRWSGQDSGSPNSHDSIQSSLQLYNQFVCVCAARQFSSA